jgi:hypothetical protein
VEDCVIYRPTKWAIRILQEQRAEGFVPCRRGVFRNNVIVFRSNDVREAVNIGSGTAPETFTFEGNWWYCDDAPTRSKPRLPAAEKEGVYGKEPGLTDPEHGDFTRKPGGSR